MTEFLRSLTSSENLLLWGIEPWRLVLALSLIIVGVASKGVIRRLFERVGRRARNTAIRWDDEAAELLPRPMSVVLQLLLWRIAHGLLLLPTQPVDVRGLTARGLDAALLVAVVWVLWRVVDVAALAAERWTRTTATRMDDQAVPLLRKTAKVVLSLVGAVFVIQNLGYSVTSVVAGLGIGGLALALAAQDSIANFFGSVVLFTDAPFQIGDYVEVDGTTGTVEEVGFRTTRIRKTDSTIVTVPNKTFTASFITNYSERRGRLIAFDFGITPGPATAELDDFLSRARTGLGSLENVRPDSVEVHLSGLGDDGIGVRVRAFTEGTDWTPYLEARESALLHVLRLLEQDGLEVARPVNTLVVDGG